MIAGSLQAKPTNLIGELKFKMTRSWLKSSSLIPLSINGAYSVNFYDMCTRGARLEYLHWLSERLTPSPHNVGLSGSEGFPLYPSVLYCRDYARI